MGGNQALGPRALELPRCGGVRYATGYSKLVLDNQFLLLYVAQVYMCERALIFPRTGCQRLMKSSNRYVIIKFNLCYECNTHKQLRSLRYNGDSMGTQRNLGDHFGDLEIMLVTIFVEFGTLWVLLDISRETH
ncbi:hypothetical protein TNCV_3721421 [Trichonephila clavipes]|nr:hypothetical protein TNCV_3721421 [Trichonephila clavipes]